MLLALLTLALLASSHAQADADPKLARATGRGRMILAGGVGFHGSNDRSDVPWPSFQTWYAYATPELTYFVRDGIGVGISLGGSYSQVRSRSPARHFDVREVQAIAGVSATLELPLGRRTSLLAIPKLSFVRGWQRLVSVNSGPFSVQAQGSNLQSQTALANQSTRDFDTLALRGSLLVPCVVHVSDVVLVGLGPELWIDRLLSDHRTDRPDTLLSIGVTTWLGFSF